MGKTRTKTEYEKVCEYKSRKLIYYSVDNKSKYVFQELRIRLKHFKVYRNFKRRSNKNESLHYQIYIRTQKTVRRNSDKKYGFHIDKAADAFFGDILWAIKFFSETSDALREDIQNSIRKNYFGKLNLALNKKADDIIKYLLKK